jgi:hypothetical protein
LECTSAQNDIDVLRIRAAAPAPQRRLLEGRVYGISEQVRYSEGEGEGGIVLAVLEGVHRLP